MYPSRLLFLPMLAACLDYDVKEKPDDAVFDPGETGFPTDTDTDTIDTHDSDTATVPEECDDEEFPAESLTPLDECGSSPTVGSFTPVTEWSWDTFTTEPTSENVMMTPIVVSLTDDDGDGDADEDDTPDIVFVTYVGTNWTGEGVLRAVSGDGSAEIFNATGYSIDGCSGVAGGDLDGDGWTDLVVVTTDKKVRAFEADGTLKWTSSAYTSNIGSYSSTPAIADMDGDGFPEVIVGNLILDSDGNRRGAGSHGIGSNGVYGTTSFAADLDGDGTQEVVTGNALYDPDGNTLWYNSESDGYVAVADFDADGVAEIVVSAGASIRVQDVDGTVWWTTAIPRASGSYGGPPTVADFDGDGEPEVGVAANSSYTVFDTDGAVLWQVTTQDSSSGVTGSAVFDFEGDGVAEAIYGDETRLWAFSGPDGSVKLESTHGERAAAIIAALAERNPGAAIDVVTHSYGGILARVALDRLERQEGPRVRRVVMLSPPNHGARLAGQIRGFIPVHEMGWDPLHQLLPGVPSTHPVPTHAEIGILTGGTGKRGYTPWLGEDNDGKVCVDEAHLPGVTDFHVIPLRHAWMPFATVAHRQILAFLDNGAFER